MAQPTALRDEFSKEGYSREEEYFYRVNRELIERRRAALDAARAARRQENQTKSYWMKCPKCGLTLKSAKVMEIEAEQCPGCQGIYLDQGELETLLQAREPQTFLKRLRKTLAIREVEPGLF